MFGRSAVIYRNYRSAKLFLNINTGRRIRLDIAVYPAAAVKKQYNAL